MYDLAITGITAFARFGRVLSQRKIPRDPLLGFVDGTNKTFFTNYKPLLTSGSAAVYVGPNQVGGTADFETGEITLTAAPIDQPVATYTFTPYTPTQILQFVISGFDEMEGRWSRDWKLVDGSGVVADETSAQILVADKDGNDPTCGNFLFSTSRIQQALLTACCEYKYTETQLLEAAIGDFQYREGLRGMLVDKTIRPENIERALKVLDETVKRVMQEAMDSYYPGGEHFGGYQSSPATAEYMETLEWQTVSKADDYRGNLGYHISLRPLIYYP